MEEERVAPGEMIITEGEQGDKLYVLEKGAVQFIKGGQVVGSVSGARRVAPSHAGRSPPSLLRQAGPGTLFGELALMYDCPRAASVRVDGPGVVWSLRREYFKALLATGATSEAVQRVNFLRVRALLSARACAGPAAGALTSPLCCSGWRCWSRCLTSKSPGWRTP